MTENRDNGGATYVDKELARLVVEHGLATQQEVEDCRASLDHLTEQDPQLTLAGVMINNGVVTERQIRRLKSTIEETRKGPQIPGYQILAKLGSGAMATVVKARQLSLDRIVAIKVLSKKLSENKEYVERFYQEGKAAAQLNHPNIVQAFDVGEASGFHYFVMEYVEGHSLYDELVSGKVFEEAEALETISQIARALEHAHAQGLIHRDVKPKNIMITKGRLAKLADMGLARFTADYEAAEAEAGKAYGTPYYISPEQIRGELDIDCRADIYSLGATLYHLVTGRVPFEAATPAAVMHKHLKEPLIPPDHINTSLSNGLGEVVEAMMAKDRNHRYATVTDLLMDLEAVAVGQPSLQAREQLRGDVLTQLAEGDRRGDQAEETVTHPASNQTVYLIILAAALIASLLFIIVLLLGGRGQ